MKKGIYVKELEKHMGEKVTAQFLILESVKRVKRDGSPYLELLLSDETGKVAGVLFEDVTEHEDLLKSGKIIEVEGVVGNFGGVPQIKLLKVKKVEKGTLEDFLVHSPRDLGEMERELFSIIEGVMDPYIKEILSRLFLRDHDFLKRFELAPAGKRLHHAYVGGLLEHTLSVTGLALKVADHYPKIKKDLLTAGALLHDIGKVDEYVFTPVADRSDPGRLLGHLVLGYKRIEKVLEGMRDFMGGVPYDTALQILHMILSHHGRLDFGSPVLPQTMEAQVLYFIDDLDAKVWMFSEASKKTREGSGRWSKFHQGLDRFVFIGEASEEEGVEQDSTEEDPQIGLFR